MTQLPEVIEAVVDSLEPSYLPYYAQGLATAFHGFYEQCRVISPDRELSAARLKLVDATRIVLAKVLHLMGITAPERM
jgi:arginyl-tRNA synthetase